MSSFRPKGGIRSSAGGYPLHAKRGFLAASPLRNDNAVESCCSVYAATIIEREFPTALVCGYTPASAAREGFDGQECPSHTFPRVPVETLAPPALFKSALERKRPAGTFPSACFLSSN
jgi:hypothetical protein